MKAADQVNRKIADDFGLTTKRIEQLVNQQNRKERQMKEGDILRLKGKPRKTPETEEIRKNDEIAKLKIQVGLLQNFLSECRRR